MASLAIRWEFDLCLRGRWQFVCGGQRKRALANLGFKQEDIRNVPPDMRF